MVGGRVFRLWGRATIACALWACGTPTRPGSTNARATEDVRRAYEPLLADLEATLAASDWRSGSAKQATGGLTQLGASSRGDGLVGFQRMWFSGHRGKVTGFSFTGRNGEIPLAAVYGPDKYSLARRVGFAVGDGSPSRAILRVTLPSDGRYLLVVADVQAASARLAAAALAPISRETDDVAAVRAYVMEPQEEETTCECPCENTKCIGDELWEVDEDGNPTRQLKTCGAGECVDVTEDGPAHGECVERTACCEDGEGLCEVDEGGTEVRKLRSRAECVVCTDGRSAEGKPQAMCETADEHCVRMGAGGCESCEEDRFCRMCGNDCVTNSAETNHHGAMCAPIEEHHSPCDGDDDPPDSGQPPQPTPHDAGPVLQPALKVILLPCNGYLSEESCGHTGDCGWCADGEGACVDGNEFGPTGSTCSDGNWRYAQ